MSLYKILHMIFGEYSFETDANNFPRFANHLSGEKLYFWRVHSKDGKVSFRTSVFHAEEIAKAAKELHVPLELTGKIGLPFLFSRYRRRYGLLLGMGVGLFLIFYSQLFVWDIEISGNTEMSVYDIEQALYDCGVSVGEFIPSIDPNTVQNRVLMSCKELSSISVSIRGTNVKVSVLERTPISDMIETEGYFNVVAQRDGIILDIDAFEGTPEVKVGDAVYEGELLINSFMEGKNGSFRPTHARGEVYAAVEERIDISIPLERVMKSYSGNTEIKTAYNVLGVTFPMFFSEDSEFEYFDAVSSMSDVTLLGFIKLPVRKYRITYMEYTPTPQLITPETAEALAYAELENILRDFGLEVLECQTEFKLDEEKGVCTLTANALLKQNIAKEVEFDINQSMSDKLPKAAE